jgi:RNA polymerase sigma-70 factor (ECF subfamily)
MPAPFHPALVNILHPRAKSWRPIWLGNSGVLSQHVLTCFSPAHLYFLRAPRRIPVTPTQPKRESTIVKDDESALVAAAKAGDSAAFEELVNRYERKIYRITQHITQNPADAEDAMQDAFVKAYEHLNDFQGGSRFYTWLVRIAVNESLMRLRKRRPGHVSLDQPVEGEDSEMPREVEDWGPSPEQRFAQTEMSGILDSVIAKLEPIYRAVFILRDVGDVSTEETARVLNISIPAVKSRLLRARLKLRELLNPYFEGSRAH